MLNNISWQGYWVTFAVLTTGYYLIIYLLFYRSDFKIVLPFREPVKKSPSSSPAITSFLQQQNQPSLFEEDGSEFTSPVNNSEEHLVYACMDELNAYFEEVKKTKCIKEEFIYALQRILSKYLSLRTSSYKESLTKVIVSEAEHQCSIHLSEDDVVKVWPGL